MVEGGGLLNRYTGLNPVSRVQIPPSPPTYCGASTCEYLSLKICEKLSFVSMVNARSFGLVRFKNVLVLRACGLDILK